MNASVLRASVRSFRIGSLPLQPWLAIVAAVLIAVPAARAQDWPGDDDNSQYAVAPQTAQGYAPQAGYAQQPLNPTDLTQLVAPIALYPDELIAQILAASTYPAQISAAAQWVQSMGNAPAAQVAAAADAQGGWDPSVKALTAVPQVLGWMAQNTQWTTALGNAYYNQPQDVMETIQVMRQRAQDAGTLQSTPQQQVYADQGDIAIAPADPQVVYVPAYDPWLVYGSPIAPYPGFAYYGPTWGGSFGFGPAVYLSAWCGWNWGWGGWGLDWWGHSVLFHDGGYWTHSRSVRDWGFPHGGPRWGGGDRGRGGDYARNGFNNGAHGVHGGPQGPVNGGNGFRQGNAFQGGGGSRSPQSGALRQGFAGQQGRPSYSGGAMQRQGGAMGYANPSPAPRISGNMPQSTLRAPTYGSGGYAGSYGGGRSQSFSSAPRGSYSAPSQPRGFAYGGQSYGGRSFSAPQASRSYGGGQSSSGHAPSGGSRQSFSGGGGGASHSFSGGGGGHSSPSGGSHGGGPHR